MDSENDVDLLLKIEHIKYRRTGPGKSSVGILFLYKNRVEWRDLISHDEVISLPLAKIKGYKLKGQRVSDPGKPKVQLQLCMHDDDRHTFVFMDPSLDHGGLSQQHGLLKKTLRQLMKKQKTNKVANKGKFSPNSTLDISDAEQLINEKMDTDGPSTSYDEFALASEEREKRESLEEKKLLQFAEMVPIRLQAERAKRAKSEKRKNVDTKASKGRKIRYVKIDKLVNFYPSPTDQHFWTHEKRNELFKSLFL